MSFAKMAITLDLEELDQTILETLGFTLLLNIFKKSSYHVYNSDSCYNLGKIICKFLITFLAHLP